MERIEFNDKDKYAIAEYIFSWEKDVLIKSDGIALIKVLEDKKLVDSRRAKSLISDVEQKSNVIGIILMTLLEYKVSPEQRKEIMDAYYKGKVNG